MVISSIYNKILFYNGIFLIILNTLINLNLLWPPTSIVNKTKRDKSKLIQLNESFNKTTNDAYNAIQYLYLMQSSKATVKSVIETESNVNEKFCYCSYCEPKLKLHNNKIEKNFEFINWLQSVNDVSETFHLFSSYWDNRKNSLYPKTSASVQVLASAFDFIENKKTPHFCHFALANKKTILFTVEAYKRIIWQRGWDPRNTFYNAYLITCPIPKNYLNIFIQNQNSCYVTVSIHKCFSNNNEINFIKINSLKQSIISKKNEQKLTFESTKSLKIGVCVKGMDFLKDEIVDRKIIEWIELQYAFGADMITIYVYHVPTSILEIFHIYILQNRLKVIIIELPGDSPNQGFILHQYIMRNRQQKRRHELISYNDCLYRHIYDYNYILIIDTDEVIVPLKTLSWSRMLTRFIEEKNLITTGLEVSAISIQNVFKFSGMEIKGSIFDEPNRSAIIQERGIYGKSFMNTKSLASVFNHFALHRLHKKVLPTNYINESVALKLHFKTQCPSELINKCDELRKNNIIDTSLLKLKNQISINVIKILQKLKEDKFS